MNTIDCWHFAGPTLRDGTPLPRKGERLPTIDDPIPCKRGYHGSVKALDGLAYAPGHYVARVRLSGTLISHGDPVDKWCASRRGNLTDYIDVRKTLRAFARMCALDMVHLWDPPAIVRQYLQTGDDDLQEAADSAAWREAARETARRAAWAATRGVMWEGALKVAWEATQATTWEAVRKVAWEAARASAWATTKDEQNEQLEKLLHAALTGENEP